MCNIHSSVVVFRDVEKNVTIRELKRWDDVEDEYVKELYKELVKRKDEFFANINALEAEFLKTDMSDAQYAPYVFIKLSEASQCPLLAINQASTRPYKAVRFNKNGNKKDRFLKYKQSYPTRYYGMLAHYFVEKIATAEGFIAEEDVKYGIIQGKIDLISPEFSLVEIKTSKNGLYKEALIQLALENVLSSEDIQRNYVLEFSIDHKKQRVFVLLYEISFTEEYLKAVKEYADELQRAVKEFVQNGVATVSFYPNRHFCNQRRWNGTAVCPIRERAEKHLILQDLTNISKINATATELFTVELRYNKKKTYVYSKILSPVLIAVSRPVTATATTP